MNHGKDLKLTTNDPKLEELKQRSHDYAIWFVETIFGSIAGLFLLGGLGAIAFGFIGTRFSWFSFGWFLIFGGSLLFVLLAILRALKDIRLNSREILRLRRDEAANERAQKIRHETQNAV